MLFEFYLKNTARSQFLPTALAATWEKILAIGCGASRASLTAVYGWQDNNTEDISHDQ